MGFLFDQNNQFMLSKILIKVSLALKVISNAAKIH